MIIYKIKKLLLVLYKKYHEGNPKWSWWLFPNRMTGSIFPTLTQWLSPSATGHQISSSNKGWFLCSKIMASTSAFKGSLHPLSSAKDRDNW